MLRFGTNSAFFFFFFFSSVQYSILPGAVWCGAVHIYFIDRFMMKEDGDPLSLSFSSKIGQCHSVAQNRQTMFFIFLL